MSKSRQMYCIQKLHPDDGDLLQYRITKKSLASGYHHGGESYIVDLDAKQLGTFFHEGRVSSEDAHCSCVGFRMWRKPPLEHKHIVMALAYANVCQEFGAELPAEYSLDKDNICRFEHWLDPKSCPII